MRDERERTVFERQCRRVAALEADTLGEFGRCLAPRFRQHPLGEINADHLRMWKVPGNREGALAGARA